MLVEHWRNTGGDAIMAEYPPGAPKPLMEIAYSALQRKRDVESMMSKGLKTALTLERWPNARRYRDFVSMYIMIREEKSMADVELWLFLSLLASPMPSASRSPPG